MRLNRLVIVAVAAAGFVTGLAPLPAARAAPLPAKVVTIPLAVSAWQSATPFRTTTAQGPEGRGVRGGVAGGDCRSRAEAAPPVETGAS